MKVSFIGLDLIGEFCSTALWDGWKERKRQLGHLLGEVGLLYQESLLMPQSAQCEVVGGWLRGVS